MTDDNDLTPTQAAAILGFAEKTLREWRSQASARATSSTVALGILASHIEGGTLSVTGR